MGCIPSSGIKTPYFEVGFSMAESSTGALPMSSAQTLLQRLPAWQVETKRADFMDWLYAIYDRDNAPLGLRGTYSGLWHQYQKDLTDLAFASYAVSGLTQNDGRCPG